jgi:glutathione S-transferase
LRRESYLLAFVADGLGGVLKAHRELFDPAIRREVADSLDLDAASRAGREQENRWDYLIGHAPSATVIAIEPHSAKQDEVTTVIKKHAAARAHLREQLRDGVRVAKWLWVASGRNHFPYTDKVRILLDQKGIEFVGRRVAAKHLPAAPAKLPRKTR